MEEARRKCGEVYVGGAGVMQASGSWTRQTSAIALLSWLKLATYHLDNLGRFAICGV
jgi:hypothetical protein